jgi:anti-sigma factor RsiW
MSALCSILRASAGGSFEDYRRDALPAPQRRILRDHLAACAECRDLAAAQDPTMLFARSFTPEELPEEDAKRILANVRTAVDFARTERRLRRTSRRRIGGAVAAAAAFGALLLMAPGGAPRVEAPLAAGRPTPAAAVSEVNSSALQSATFTAETDGSPTEATVYEWSPGAGREEPRVVWIVDRGLDI